MMIRMAKDKDIDDIAEIFRELHEYHVQLRPDYYRSADIAFFRNAAAETFHGDGNITLVSENNGFIDGYAVIMISERKDELRFYRKVCFIDQIAVKQGFRRRGTGRGLMAHIKAYAAENGCNSVELGVWYENCDAVDFYVKNGFMPRMMKMELKL